MPPEHKRIEQLEIYDEDIINRTVPALAQALSRRARGEDTPELQKRTRDLRMRLAEQYAKRLRSFSEDVRMDYAVLFEQALMRAWHEQLKSETHVTPDVVDIHYRRLLTALSVGSAADPVEKERDTQEVVGAQQQTNAALQRTMHSTFEGVVPDDQEAFSAADSRSVQNMMSELALRGSMGVTRAPSAKSRELMEQCVTRVATALRNLAAQKPAEMRQQFLAAARIETQRSWDALTQSYMSAIEDEDGLATDRFESLYFKLWQAVENVR